MANITLLHWNIEQLGNQKFNGDNQGPLLNYIAGLANAAQADIISIVEVKNAQSPWFITTMITLLTGNWSGSKVNSRKNNEEYIIMFRTDKLFTPIAFNNGQVVNSAYPQGMLIDTDVFGQKIPFQSSSTGSLGRMPYYLTFRTTDTNRNFSVILYHGMFNRRQTYVGVENIARLSIITQFNAIGGAPAQPIYGSIISGDFNLDFNEYNEDYEALLQISTNAVNTETSMVNKPPQPPYLNQPAAYLVNAYDNIFQKPQRPAPVQPWGYVFDLMVQSANVNNNPSHDPPEAVNLNGVLAGIAGTFDIQVINERIRYVGTVPINVLPPADMLSSWAFVREVISNHYPVVATATF